MGSILRTLRKDRKMLLFFAGWYFMFGPFQVIMLIISDDMVFMDAMRKGRIPLQLIDNSIGPVMLFFITYGAILFYRAKEIERMVYSFQDWQDRRRGTWPHPDKYGIDLARPE